MLNIANFWSLPFLFQFISVTSVSKHGKVYCLVLSLWTLLFLFNYRAVFTWLSKGIGFGFGFTTPFGWLVYLLWFWFYDSQVKTALRQRSLLRVKSWMKLYTCKRRTLNHNIIKKEVPLSVEGGICYKTSCASFVITVKAYEKTEFRLTQMK